MFLLGILLPFLNAGAQLSVGAFRKVFLLSHFKRVKSNLDTSSQICLSVGKPFLSIWGLESSTYGRLAFANIIAVALSIILNKHGCFCRLRIFAPVPSLHSPRQNKVKKFQESKKLLIIFGRGTQKRQIVAGTIFVWFMCVLDSLPRTRVDCHRFRPPRQRDAIFPRTYRAFHLQGP